MNIVNLGYDSTNYYLLSDGRPRLLIDVGFPQTLPKMEAAAKRMGVHLKELKYFLVTHYHPDHAGLAQELKNLGIRLIVMKVQVPAIPELKKQMKATQNYLEIKLTDNLLLDFDESRKFLDGLGIQGEIIHTPGHSDDSISLILDSGEAFTGDFPMPFLRDFGDSTINEGWGKMKQLNVKRVYPGHGPIIHLDEQNFG